MRADDPGPLEVNGVVGAQAGNGTVIGVGVLEPDLVPVACRPGDVGRISEGLVAAVLGVLHPIEEKAGAPLPVPLVGNVRVQTDRKSTRLNSSHIPLSRM